MPGSSPILNLFMFFMLVLILADSLLGALCRLGRGGALLLSADWFLVVEDVDKAQPPE